MTMTSLAPSMAAAPQAQADAAARTIPFDYLFSFKLTGEPGNTLRKTVAVSVGASFTAASVGYGVVPEISPVVFGLPPAALAGKFIRGGSVRELNLGDLMDAIETAVGNAPDARRDTPPLEAALRNGLRLNATFARKAMFRNGNVTLEPDVLASLFQLVPPPARDVQFLYALFDEGTGREFQSDPILNVAGLGASDGKRPFRYFAQPITFAPRSTIRMDVTEVGGFHGELHVALHGYKVLAAGGAPANIHARRARRGGR